MDFDVSTPSVTEALGDLQLKMQSIEEDRDLYAMLEAKASASFERHRAELTLLLQKERAIHAASEDRLREELQRLLTENETSQSQLAALRTQNEQRCREEIRLRQQQREEREAKLQREFSELREQWNETRLVVDLAQQEKAWHEMQLREVLEKQQSLNLDMQRVQREAEEQLALEEEEQRRRRFGQRHCTEKIFLPTGLPDQCHTRSPSSHHIAAIVSTVERNNFYRPRLYYRRRGITSPMEARVETPLRCRSSRRDNNDNLGGTPGEIRPPPLLRPSSVSTSTTVARKGAAASSIGPTVGCCTATESSSHVVTNSARHLVAVCRSLLREILQLRKEYQECTASLNNPSEDSVELSRRMRGIMSDLDRKVHQLRSLRQQQAKVEDKLKLHDMMMEIAMENNYCESIYSDLLELIRS